MWSQVASRIAATQQRPFSIERHVSIGGGCINQAYRLEGLGQTYFVKVNSIRADAMYGSQA